jgi:hypothetical protein
MRLAERREREDVPQTPTLPLFGVTFLTSQSIVSQASVVSSVSERLKAPRGTRYIAYCPCDLKRPRRSCATKM